MQNKKRLITDVTASVRARKILEILEGLNKHVKIIDVGCGSGFFVNYIKSAGYDIIGIDKYNSKTADWISSDPDYVMDATHMEFEDNSFDVVLAIELLEHCYCIDEIKRVLKPNGILIATAPSLGTNWLHKIVEAMNLAQCQNGGSATHKLFNLKKIDMELINYKKMFLGTSQFGVFKNNKPGPYMSPCSPD